MRKLTLSLLTLIMLFIVGCNSNSSIRVDSFDIDDVESAEIIEWINNNKTNGIYLSQSKNEAKLYLYVNYSNEVNSETYKASSTSVGYANGETNLVIKVVPQLSSNETTEKLYVIHYLNKKIKGVNLNNTVITFENIIEID